MVWVSTPALHSVRHPGEQAETSRAIPSVCVVPGPPRSRIFKGGCNSVFSRSTT